MKRPTALSVLAASVGGLIAADRLARRTIARFETVDLDSVELPGQRFWVRGVGVHYRQLGSGLPVVLVHGFGGSSFSFRFCEAALAAHFRVISVDLPGFGFSDRSERADLSLSGYVRLLSDFMQQSGISRAVVLGHSMGAAIVERLAAEQPQLVERLILVAPAWSRRRAPRGGLVTERIALLFQAILVGRPGLLRRMGAKIVARPEFFDGAELEGYLRPLRVKGTAAAIRRLLTAAAREAAPAHPASTVRTLVLWGEQDPTMRPTRIRALRQRPPSAQLSVVPRAGHLVLEEQPEQANALIFEFLRDLAARDPQQTPLAASASPQK